VAPVADRGLGELAGEDLPAVHVDLDLEGEPALEADMDEPEGGVEEVEVQVQALAPPAPDLEATGLRVAGDVEGAAGLHRREHAHEALGDAVTLDHLLGHVPLECPERLVMAWGE
jgi:hypothetical protein